MKKILAIVLALAMVLSVVACAKTEAPAAEEAVSAEAVEAVAEAAASAELPTIQFWTTGSQNVSDIFTEVVKAYNAKADRKANVELQFILSGTGDAGLKARYAAAYQSGDTKDFDMIADNGSDFLLYAQEAGSEDCFLTLDTSKMSNFANVKMTPCVLTDKLVPYRGTTVVFSYDSAKLENPPTTWDELMQWTKDNPGLFTYNDPDTGGAGKAFVLNAVYRCIDDPTAFETASDEKWQDYYDAGFEWLEELHPNLYSSGGHIQYAVKNQGALDLLASGEVVMVPAWADGTLQALEQGTLPSTVKMYQLSDLSLTGSDVDMAICANSQHVEECYDFMNFVISAEAQGMFVEQMKAVPVIDASTLEQTASVAAVSELNPAEFNILSVGTNENVIKERWATDIATLG